MLELTPTCSMCCLNSLFCQLAFLYNLAILQTNFLSVLQSFHSWYSHYQQIVSREKYSQYNLWFPSTTISQASIWSKSPLDHHLFSLLSVVAKVVSHSSKTKVPVTVSFILDLHFCTSHCIWNEKDHKDLEILDHKFTSSEGRSERRNPSRTCH